MIGIGSIFILASIYITMDTIKSKVILYKDHLEIHDMMPMRHIHRFDILGYRYIQENHAETLVFIPHNTSKKKVKVHLTIQTDDAFDAWVSSLDNLDQRETNKEIENIKHTIFQSKSDDYVITEIEQANKQARNINIASIISVIALFFISNIYTITIAALFPLIVIAITAKYKGLFVLMGNNKLDIHPNFDLCFLMPGIILFLRALLDVNVLDSQKLFIFTILGGLLLSIISLNADKSILKQQKFGALAVFIIMAVYSYGTISIYNKLLDTSYPQTFKTTILSHHMTSSKISQPELNLAPWGNQTEKNRSTISKELYKSVKKGDTI